MEQSTEAELKQQIQIWLQSSSQMTPVVVVPVFNAYDDVLECVNSLLAQTRSGVPILVLDDASSDTRVRDRLEPLARERGFAYARMPVNSGFVHTVNCAFDWCAPHDVVVVNSDVIVPAEWLQRLQAAAYSQSNIATATPLTNSGTLVSIPYRNLQVSDLVNGLTLDQIDERVRAASLMLRPVIPTAVGHLTYFKRAMLDTVGFFDEAFSPGYGEEVDISQRAVAAGFCHVAADDLFVFHKGSRSFGQMSEARRRLQELHDHVIYARYPWYLKWVDEATHDLRGPLALALERASTALLGYQIAIDATCVNGTTTGTQVLTLELIHALATAPDRSGRLSIIVGDAAPRSALLGVESLVDEVVPIGQLRRQDPPRFDLIHRPFQVTSANDIMLLESVAKRFIVSHLDCISYSDPVYMLSAAEWITYRRQTEYVFAAVDGMVFISQHAAQDAAHNGLKVPPERMCVTYVGVDHHLHVAHEAKAPAGSELFRDQPFLLVIGTNFKHKNRAYAIRLLKALVDQHHWTGQLVLAGPHVASGGSEDEEARELSRDAKIRGRVHDIGAVDEAGKVWLMRHAALILYPSLYEGFGIVPFEAAAYGTPAITSRSTALNEVLGDQVVYLDSFNPVAGAETIWTLLSDAECARRQVDEIRARAASFAWDKVARTTWDFYRQILKMPPRPLAVQSTPMSTALAWKRVSLVEPTEGSVQAWLRRISVGWHVLQRHGIGGLRKEIRQYLQWRMSQF